MTLESVLDHCRDLVSQPLGAVAERWKADRPDGRVVAVYPVWAPAELIHAAGMLPLGLFGGGTSVELTHADARFQSFVCSVAKSSLELGFQDRLRGIDGFVFSNICDVARNLAAIYKRNFPGTFVAYLHLPQNSTSPAVAAYTTAELRRLATGFAEAFGLDVLETALATDRRPPSRARALSAPGEQEPDADGDEAQAGGEPEVLGRDPPPELGADEDREQARRDQRARRRGEDPDLAEVRIRGEQERRELGLVAELGHEDAEEHRRVSFHRFTAVCASRSAS